MIQTRVIQDLTIEPVTLSDAKAFMNIDFNDFDTLILKLIKASRLQSERISGRAYGEKIIEVTGNTLGLKVYPILPFIEAVDWVDQDGDEKYRYKAGFIECPEDLKFAILQRVATGFAYRENLGQALAMSMASSHYTERQYQTYLAF